MVLCHQHLLCKTHPKKQIIGTVDKTTTIGGVIDKTKCLTLNIGDNKMKKNFDVAAKVVASAALLGNLNNDVVRRMVKYITDQTTDNNIICSLLQGLVIDVKINDKEKLAKIISEFLDENICKIVDAEVIVCDQDIRVTYICKRFAKTADETKIYNTNSRQDNTYAYEVEVQDSYRVDINNFDFEDSVEFEVI